MTSPLAKPTSKNLGPVAPRAALWLKGYQARQPDHDQKAFSYWLDFFRWVAAFVVMWSHAGGILLTPLSRSNPVSHTLIQFGYSFIAGFAHYAVMIFFVMSGFLIGGGLVRLLPKRIDLPVYLTRRIVRLSVVLLPTLVLSATLAWAVTLVFGAAAADRYQGAGGSALSWGTAFCNAAYLQNVLCGQFAGNDSLWSLTHEFWYYICFPLLLIGLATKASVQTLAMAAAGFLILVLLTLFQRDTVPIGLYFLFWLAGVAVYCAGSVRSIGRPRIWLLSLGGILLLVRILPVAFDGFPEINFFSDFAVSIFFSLLLISLRSRNIRPPVFAGLHTSVARFSFTLYCVHIPFLVAFRALAGTFVHVHDGKSPPGMQQWGVVVVGLALTVIFAYLMYLLFEKHTDRVRALVEDRMLRRPSQIASSPS